MRIVPRVVFGTICVGVIPAVAVSCDDPAGCTGPGCAQLRGVAADAFSEGPFGVAAVAFQCFDGSTAPQCLPQPDGATDAPHDGDADAQDARDG
jgi:hypothetical protein